MLYTDLMHIDNCSGLSLYNLRLLSMSKETYDIVTKDMLPATLYFNAECNVGGYDHIATLLFFVIEVKLSDNIVRIDFRKSSINNCLEQGDESNDVDCFSVNHYAIKKQLQLFINEHRSYLLSEVVKKYRNLLSKFY